MKKLCKYPLIMCCMTLMILCLSGSAWAEFRFPSNLAIIEDEAFMDVPMGYSVTIPETVTSIGSKAFVGSGVEYVTLSDSLTYIAPDAFEMNTGFYVVPNSYAQSWCIENNYDYNVNVFSAYIAENRENTAILYPGDIVTGVADYPYPDQVSYQWEYSEDSAEWYELKGLNENNIYFDYMENYNYLYFRCQLSVNGAKLTSNMITIVFRHETMEFTNACRALSGDAVYLEWEYQGQNAKYYLYQRVLGNETVPVSEWEKIAELNDMTSFTVYGLGKNTNYEFTIVALLYADNNCREGDEWFRAETIPIHIATLENETAVNIIGSKMQGTSLLLSWDSLQNTKYRIWYSKDNKNWNYKETDNNYFSLFGLEPDTFYYYCVEAYTEETMHRFYSSIWVGLTGKENETLLMNDPIVRGEMVHVSWSELYDVEYNLYFCQTGKTEELVADHLTSNGFEFYELERNVPYNCRVVAVSTDGYVFTSETISFILPTENDIEYRALLIGEVNFPFNNKLLSGYNDVNVLNDVLLNAQTPEGNGLSSTMRFWDLSKEEIFMAIQYAFRNADENDVSIFYISTHGDVSWSGRRAGSLLTIEKGGDDEGTLLLEELASALSEVKGTVIVWIDSCGSGAAVYDEKEAQNGDDDFNIAVITAFNAHDPGIMVSEYIPESSGQSVNGLLNLEEAAAFETGEFRRTKFYVLTASRYQQVSKINPSYTISYFTLYLCRGIGLDSGISADTNNDGLLTQHELFSYVNAAGEYDNVAQKVQTYPMNSEYVLFKRS